MMEEAAVTFTEVSKVYPGGVKALDRISLRIPRGEWVAVMGPSGSGKTTFLNILDGLDRPTSGRVRLLDTDIAGLAPADAAVFRRENIGLVFQQFYLVPYLTVLENVMLAQYFHSMVDEGQAREMLESVGMGHRALHLPSQLSGGEQQRTCIARALVNDPGILLADEPTGNLDEANEEKVCEIFRKLHKSGKTVIVVTHDRALGDLAQRRIMLNHGRIAQDTRHGNGTGERYVRTVTA
jgi:putative ABC transport system ATP-binding protein